VGSLRWEGGQTPEVGQAGEVTMKIRQALVDIQYGRADDAFGWMRRIC
jgi:branched-chain amino acid aminotransferase